jgi:hypothetical protein
LSRTPAPAGSPAPVVGIFSLAQDLHAYAVAQAVRETGATSHVFATDDLAASSGASWWGPPSPRAVLSTTDGALVDVASLSVIWWRRVNQSQTRLPDGTTDTESALISNEWRAFTTGAVRDVFTGAWVNDPDRDALAGNKLVQLRAATAAGFDVPPTLVSSVPDDVVRFTDRMGGAVIAKKLVGAPPAPLATVVVTAEDLVAHRSSIAACPTMYQQVVPGRRHLRINCFGESVHAFLIESDLLDWRRDLTVPFVPYDLDEHVQDALRRTLAVLGLRMAVMDAKLTDDDRLVWLELNVQGQFLFCEALTGVPLSAYAARFLVDEAARVPASLAGV